MPLPTNRSLAELVAPGLSGCCRHGTLRPASSATTPGDRRSGKTLRKYRSQGQHLIRILGQRSKYFVVNPSLWNGSGKSQFYFLDSGTNAVSATRVREVSHMLKAIHAQESRDAAEDADDLPAAKMSSRP